jgi:hypothetical protein
MTDLTPQAAVLTAAFSSPVPAAPSSSTSAPMAAPTAPPSSSPVGPQGEITDAQGVQIVRDIQKDLATGKISQAQADARFAEMHTPLDQRVIPFDNRTDEQRLIDDHFPPAQEKDFLIRYFPPGREPQVMPKELHEFDQHARGWLSAAQFDRTLCNSLVTQISRVAQHTNTMTPDQLETYGENEYVKLQATYKDTLEDKLRQAGRMVEDLDKKQPGLKNLLRSKGIGDSALVASILIGQSEIYWARRKGR